MAVDDEIHWNPPPTGRHPWTTVKDNHIDIGGASLRVVWDEIKGIDVAYVIPDGTEDEGNANARLIASAPRLRDACRAVLLFHSGADWNEERRNEWHALTGEDEATTKILCGTVRRALAGID